MAELDGEERVLATAQHIVRSLGTTDNMTDDMLNILSNFDDRFSGINSTLSKNLGSVPTEELPMPAEMSLESKASLDEAEEVIMKWEAASPFRTEIFDSSSDEDAKYLGAVDDLQNILASLSVSECNVTENRVHNILQVAMTRLQEEFLRLLAWENQPLDPDLLLDHLACSFSSNNDKGPDLESKSFSEVSMDSNHREASEDVASQSSDEEEEEVQAAELPTDPIIDLLPSAIVKSLHEIALRMTSAGYKRECCQVYGRSRKPFLEETLCTLGFENLSIDEVQKMPWEALEVRIKKWIQAMNVAVKVLLPSERELCENVFENSIIAETCFADLSRTSILQLLSFSEAIAISRRSPEKLFKLLDMYETLRDLLPEISSIFSGDSCAGIRDEASEILQRLGEGAKGIFTEFENAIYKDTSRVPIPGGGVHPLTRYVMNYVRFLFDYIDTLKHLFDEDSGMSNFRGDDMRSCVHNGRLSPLAAQTISITNVLMNNLDGKSKLYKDLALTYLFLMNNLRYIVQKVDGSEVQALLGNDWLRKQTSLVRRYATDYQRSAWTKVLACIKDEGIRTSGSFSNGVSKAVLKDRFKSFNATFDDIYKTQSSWLVPDSQLRLELRISIAETLLPAYRSFLGRYRSFLESERHSEKYIKYTPEDLETYLNDFFEGRMISHQRGKSSYPRA